MIDECIRLKRIPTIAERLGLDRGYYQFSKAVTISYGIPLKGYTVWDNRTFTKNIPAVAKLLGEEIYRVYTENGRLLGPPYHIRDFDKAWVTLDHIQTAVDRAIEKLSDAS
jgi:hypothetical protein